MRTLSENKIFKAALILTALMMLSACGANKSYNPGDSDQSSSVPDTAAKAVCSKNIEKDEVKIQVSAYYDSYGQYYASKFRVKLAVNPADWNANNWDMTIRLITVSSNGNIVEGSSVPFSLEQRNGTSYTGLTPAYNVLSAEESFQIAKIKGYISNDTVYSNFNPQSLYGSAHIVAHTTDTSGAFQILRVEFRTHTEIGNGAVVKYYDTLLPIYHADPKEYAKTHHATLQALHPLKAYASNDWTQAQYKALADQSCF